MTQAQTGVSRARVNLGFCTITAPVSGMIGEILVRTGDQVSPATQLTIVSGNRQMEAWFSVPESLLEAGVAEGVEQSEKSNTLPRFPM